MVYGVWLVLQDVWYIVWFVLECYVVCSGCRVINV